ncbi:MAG: NAD(P)/FAD-dependent oxidoreductase [Xanthomonadales bacterium]|nr:NAD(P)/FAD-dependent oxidoreductase [Xanthomonadales bacterium]
MSTPPTDHDVIIVGGGLAGLSLALQLRREHPALRVLVLERREGAAPEAAFKIGESTVEIAAHYFGRVLGLKQHLDERHIVKFGFRFFFSDHRDRIDHCAELGASQALPTGAWQIDRGRFENFLVEQVQAEGIDLRLGCSVQGIDLDDGGAGEGVHRARWRAQGGEHEAGARWLVDASGRAGLLRRKLNLETDNGHRIHAAWFRVKGHLKIDAWSDDPAWVQRCHPPERWRSTNHLVGPGYWVWLIPLGSGSHSVGVVCDPDVLPIERIQTLDAMLAWIEQHQPALARALEPVRGSVQDFGFLRRVSYGCRQLFSAQRWALTGEAGAFLDPFYSPGSDFIAIANTYICRLIGKDLAGEAWEPYAAVYDQLFQSFYESTLAMYRGQYPLFGDPVVLPLKVLWDYTYYWGVLGPLFFADRLDDLPTLSRLRSELAEAKQLNIEMQRLFAVWGAREPIAVPAAPSRSFLDQACLDWFAELNRGLRDPLDDAAFRARLRANLDRLRKLAEELTALADASAQQSPLTLIEPDWRGVAAG